MIRPLFQMKQHDAANDPFQCLLLKPIYVRNDANMSSTETVYKAYDSLSNIFKSVNGLRFVGISVLLATVNEGYLYQFSNNGEWSHKFNVASRQCPSEADTFISDFQLFSAAHRKVDHKRG